MGTLMGSDEKTAHGLRPRRAFEQTIRALALNLGQTRMARLAFGFHLLTEGAHVHTDMPTSQDYCLTLQKYTDTCAVEASDLNRTNFRAIG